MILANHGIVSSSGGLPPSTLLTNLYAVYKAENNANDSLGTYNGTAQGGLTYSTGKSGNAFTFNGTNAYVDLGNNIFNSFTNDFSVSGWLNLSSVSGYQGVIHNQSYNTLTLKSNGWGIIMRGSFLVFEIYTNSPTYSQLFSSALSTSTWIHVTITRKASTRSRIYVNGVLVNSNTSTLNPVYDTTLIPIPSSIGAYRSDATNVQDYFNGKIDEIGVWNKELTSIEITDLYNSGTGKFYPTF